MDTNCQFKISVDGQTEAAKKLLKDTQTIKINTENYGPISFEIQFERPKKKNYLVFRTYFDVEKNAASIYESYKNSSVTKNLSRKIAIRSFGDDSLESIFNFIGICNLCRPGCISNNQPATIRCEEEKWSGHSLRNNFDFLFEEKNQNFPPLYDLGITDALEYFSNLKGFWGGFSDSNVGRAMLCFTHLFSDHYQWVFPNDFLWSMIGLEALYGQGNQAMMNQIIKKSQTFLNLEVKSEKPIKDMYDFRSRIFHGQVNITNPILFSHGQNIKKSPYSEKETEATTNTVHLFILSLQKCIIEKIYELDFKYVLNKNI